MRNITDIVTKSDQEPWQTHKNLPRRDYEQIIAMNPSTLAAGLVGVSEVDVRAIKETYETGLTSAVSDDMDRGTLAHLLLLQPELLADRVAVWDGGRRSGKEWDEFCANSIGKIQLRRDDYDHVLRITNMLRSQPMVSESICDGEPEVAVVGVAEAAGLTIRVKGQLDLVRVRDKTIVDIKTTSKPLSHIQCERSIRDFRYREKMALYRQWIATRYGDSPDEWKCYNLFLCIGERPSIRRVKFATDSLEFGYERMRNAMVGLCKAIQCDQWPVLAVDDIVSVARWECEMDEGGVNYDD
jgi:hypothetical protein